MSLTPIPNRHLTADEFWALPEDHLRHELVAGEVLSRPLAGFESGVIAAQLLARLWAIVDANRLGAITAASAGFVLRSSPDTVRVPTVSFVRQARLQRTGIPQKFFPGPPDLAVEVISPSDNLNEVDAKVQDYLAARTVLVWVVNPKWRNVTAYRSARDIQVLTEADQLTAPDLLPGFECRVGELFPNAPTTTG